jgi:hypothetical protein
MIFDHFCGIVERHLPELERILREARLFVYEKPAHEMLPQEIAAERKAWLHGNFFLPFNTVAVEDPGSCVVFQDLSEDARGIAELRRFFECMPMMVGDEGAYDPRVDNPEVVRGFIKSVRGTQFEDAYVISVGTVSMKSGDGTGKDFIIEGNVDFLIVASKRGVIRSASGGAIPQQVGEAALRNVGVALQEMMMLNTPDRFVVEMSPAARETREAPKIPRSDRRAVYTLLHPAEIRRIMGLPDTLGDGRASPAPHERRRHVRVLRSERFTASVRGKSIVIPATWVGPSEAVRGAKRYKVLLDL